MAEKIDTITPSVPKVDVKEEESAKAMADRKKITVEEAQKLINELRDKRVEEERKKAIDDEKKRRLDGQKMAETRTELQDQERIRLAQQIRREKLEKEEHRKQVLEQIARDREAMKAKTQPQTEQTPKSSLTCPAQANKPPSTECKIALRFADGSNVIHTFKPSEKLSAVRLFAQTTKKIGTVAVTFVAPPNKKLTEVHMNDTLESLGLCPASRLEVKIDNESFSDNQYVD